MFAGLAHHLHPGGTAIVVSLGRDDHGAHYEHRVRRFRSGRRSRAPAREPGSRAVRRRRGATARTGIVRAAIVRCHAASDVGDHLRRIFLKEKKVGAQRAFLANFMILMRFLD